MKIGSFDIPNPNRATSVAGVGFAPSWSPPSG